MGALLAGLLADPGGLVPGVAELLLELGQLGVGLGLLGLGLLQAALDRRGALGVGLLEVRDDELLDREEEQTEDDEREDDLDRVRDERVAAPPPPLRGRSVVMHGCSPSGATDQRTNASAIPMMASASASAKPRMAIDWRRLWASGWRATPLM